MAGAYLNALDGVVIALYLGVLLILGVYLQGRASAGLRHYLVGDRSMPWWMLGVSGVMDFWDLAGSMVIVSFLYLLGPQGLFVEFRGGAVLVLAVTMLWTGKWRRRSGCITSAEWMLFRFGDNRAGRAAQLARVVAGIAITTGLIAYLAKSAGLFLSMFLPLTPAQCAMLLIGTATIYSMFSGFYGVVIIHALQFLIVLVAAAAIIHLCVSQTPDFAALQDVAAQVTGNPDWGATLPAVRVAMPAGYEAYEPLLLLAGLYLLRNVLFGMGAGDDPKYFAAKSDVDCAKLSLLWITLIAVRWPTMMAIAVLGVVAVGAALPDPAAVREAVAAVNAAYPDGDWDQITARIAASRATAPTELTNDLRQALGDDWPTRLQLTTRQGTVNPERVVPAVLLYAIPPGLRSLVIVSLMAAAMAGFGAWINQAAGLFTNDFYLKHVRPAAPVREQITVTWAFILAIVTAGLTFAYSATNINDIWSWIIMGLGGGMIFPQMLPLYWRRFNGFGYAAGMIAGLTAALAQRTAASMLPPVYEVLNEEWCMLLVIGVVSLIAAVTGSCLTSPTPATVLQDFFNRTRPFGWWRRERESLPRAQQETINAENLRDLLALPVALTYQVAIFLAPMLLVVQKWSHAGVCFAVALATFAILYYAWLAPMEQTTPQEDLL
ncbi:sodium:solute symporter family transporter [Botrimarina mediterranea]|uniref:sodium:solute symporter family transporter n=1 Tax=Botrimarina mediterranea TaxID=2528022 RepID=UPI00118A0C56|nr:sodium/panthothenate symporter [Planctomycetes bacterium K2D]